MTTRSEVSSGDRPFSSVRRYWSSFLKFAGAELEEYSASFTLDWPFFLGWSMAVSAVVVASLHAIELLSFRATDNRILESFALAPATLLAVALIGLLVWAYWRIRIDTVKEHPYIVAVLAFVLTIGVGVVAFAGASAVHLEGDSSSPGLWAMEQAYIWHILDAVPLLALPATIGWNEPNVTQDHLSGALLLVFKIAVLLPVVRLGVSGYFFVERRLLEGRQRRRREQEHGISRRYAIPLRLESRDIATALPLGVAVAGAIYVAWTFLFDPASWPTRPLDRLIPDTVGAGDFHVGLGWVSTLPQWLGAAVIVFLLFWVFAMAFAFELQAKKWWVVAGACAVYVCVLVLLTEAAVAILLALTHVGAIPEGSSLGNEVRAAYSYFVWPVADAVPGLDVPATLNWQPVDAFDSTVGGVLQLFYKFTFFLVVLFPLARALRSYSQESRPGAAPRAGLAAVADFARAYHVARAALDQAAKDVLQERQSPLQLHRPTAHLRLGTRYPASGLQQNPMLGAPLIPRSWASVEAARKQLGALGASLEGVKALFGTGPATERAEQLLRAGAERLRAIEDARPTSLARHPGTRPAEPALEDTKRLFEAAASAYAAAAAADLHESAPAV
jgi:hypothetical protein